MLFLSAVQIRMAFRSNQMRVLSLARQDGETRLRHSRSDGEALAVRC